MAALSYFQSLEREVNFGIPQVTKDVAELSGFMLFERKAPTINALYKDAFDQVRNSIHALIPEVEALNQALASNIDQLPRDTTTVSSVEGYYNRLYEFIPALKGAFDRIRETVSLPEALELDVQKLFKALTTQRKLILKYLEGDLREALNEVSKSNLSRNYEA